jgi:hypothetical protein
MPDQTGSNGNISVDPLLVDAAGNNFNLQAASPAIDAGTDVSLTSDFISTSVPRGEAEDIGAYEYIVSYYVDQDAGSDSANGRTPATAWKTVAGVEGKTISPGDTVLFERGDTWGEQFDIAWSGTAGNPITFGAYGSGNPPKIDGGGVRPFCITGGAKNYITVQDFWVTGWINTGIHNQNGTNWTIQRNLVAVGGNNSNPDHGIRVWSSAAAPLREGIVIDANTVGAVNTVYSAAIGNNGIFVQGVTGARITNNSVNTTYVTGIRASLNVSSADNTDILIEGNDVYGSYTNIILFQTDDSVVRYNRVHDTTGAGIAIAFDTDDVQIYYNLIYNITADSPTVLGNGFDITNDSDNGELYNNTVYSVYRHSLMFDDEAGSVPNGWIVKNNIFDASENVAAAEGDPQDRGIPIGIRKVPITLTADYNILTPGEPVDIVASYGDDDGVLKNLPEWQGLGYDANSTDNDPVFSDPTSADFTLGGGSPAYNAGVAVDVPQRDIAGNKIVGDPDMGAYEKQ